MRNSTNIQPVAERCIAATRIGSRAGIVAIACVSVCLAVIDAGARPFFSAPYLAFDAGPSPIAVSVADVNADGLADLLVANDVSHEIAVLIGQGEAFFGAPAAYETAGASVSVATGDLDGDGAIDLVAANGGTYEAPTNSVSILLGNGDGTFAPHIDLVTGTRPQHVALGDLDRDGDLDIVSVDNDAHGVSVFLGAGDGGFATASAFATNVFPSSVAIGDVNGDAIPDLAVAHAGIEAVSVLLGNGDGTFGFRTDCWVAGGSGSIFLTDVEQDGNLDILTASGGTISLLLGHGDGTFAADRTIPSTRTVSYLTVADVNGDGHPDLVRADGYSNTTTILFGRGDATFVEGESYTGGSFQGDAAVADVDGDGDADLVFPKYGGVVAVLQNRGDGSFNSERLLAIGLGPSALATGDLNADGSADIVATVGSSAAVFLGAGRGEFTPRALFATGGGSVALADVNRDGRLDAVSPNAVMLGNGDGSFAAPQVMDNWGGDIALGNLDGDEYLDLVAANAQGQRVWIRQGRGDGSFERRVDYPCVNGCRQVALADLNADGFDDVAVTNAFSSEVTVYLGSGDGRLHSRRDYPTGTPCQSVAIGDLDVDGNLDLVTVNGYRDASLAVLRGLGDGTFAAAELQRILPEPTFVALEDVNGDEAPDVMVSHAESQSVTLLLNDGEGALHTACGFGTGNNPRALLFADVDANGRRDLIVANEVSGSLSLLMNSMSPTPVAVEGLQAEIEGAAVRLSWRCSADLVEGRSRIRVLRSDAGLGDDFVPVSPLLPAMRDMVFEDPAAVRGRTYRYRLQLHGPDGRVVVSGEIDVAIPASPSTGLLARRSADGAVEIRYSLAEDVGDMRLAVFDVRGRTVRLLHAGHGEKGEHLVLWNGLDASGLRPSHGMYLVRMVAGVETCARKLLFW